VLNNRTLPKKIQHFHSPIALDCIKKEIQRRGQKNVLDERGRELVSGWQQAARLLSLCGFYVSQKEFEFQLLWCLKS
jgi:hypothetical protein